MIKLIEIALIYATIIIVLKQIENTKYEKIVLLVAFTGVVLTLTGLINY